MLCFVYYYLSVCLFFYLAMTLSVYFLPTSWNVLVVSVASLSFENAFLYQLTGKTYSIDLYWHNVIEYQAIYAVVVMLQQCFK